MEVPWLKNIGTLDSRYQPAGMTEKPLRETVCVVPKSGLGFVPSLNLVRKIDRQVHRRPYLKITGPCIGLHLKINRKEQHDSYT